MLRDPNEWFKRTPHDMKGIFILFVCFFNLFFVLGVGGAWL
jgi:hypothetical protein